MAITFYEHFGWAPTLSSVPKRNWVIEEDAGLNRVLINLVSGRFDGEQAIEFLQNSSLSINQIVTAIRRFIQSGSSGILSLALYLHASLAGSLQFITLYETAGNYAHVNLSINSNLTLTLRRGSTSLVTSTAALPLDTWNRLEFKYYIDNTSGYAVVRLNGEVIINFSGDTQDIFGTSNIDAVRINNPYFGPPGSDTHVMRVTSIMHQNSIAPHNDFIGDVQHARLRPVADIVTGWTPSEGSDNYALVDEDQIDTTDHVLTASSAVEDEYEFSDLEITPVQIFGVQCLYAASKSEDTGTRTIKSRLKSGEDTVDGEARGLTTGTQVFSDVFNTDPATNSAWTISGVNGITGGPVTAT